MVQVLKKYLSLLNPSQIAAKLFEIKLPGVLRSPLALSGLIHLLLLCILALVFVKPGHHVKWHTFEWEQIYSFPLPQTRGDSKAIESQEQAGVIPITTEASDLDESTAPITSAEPLEGQSELIELPRITHTQKTSSPVSLPTDTRGMSHLRDLPIGGSSGRGSTTDGFGTDFEGQGVNVLQRVVPTIAVSQYGTVTMQFRLSSDGRVIPESITVQSYTASQYLQASISALEKWRFSFIGRYSPNRVYKITFIYNPS